MFAGSLKHCLLLTYFEGHVPEALLKYYPDAQIYQASEWGNFNSTYETW